MAPIKQFFDVFGVQEFYNNDMKRVEEIFLGTGTDSQVATAKPTQLLHENEMNYDHRHIQATQQQKWYTIEGEAMAADGPLGQLIIKEPAEFQNKTFMSHLNEIPWEEPLLTKRIEESFYKGQHLTFCRKRDDSLALVSFKYTLKIFSSYPIFRKPRVQRDFWKSELSGSSLIYTYLRRDF